MPRASAGAMAFVPTTQPDLARGFYRDALWPRLRGVDEYASVFDLNGNDIVAELEALQARGVSFECYGFFEQDAHGIWTAPGEHAGIGRRWART